MLRHKEESITPGLLVGGTLGTASGTGIGLLTAMAAGANFGSRGGFIGMAFGAGVGLITGIVAGKYVSTHVAGSNAAQHYAEYNQGPTYF